MTKWDYKFVFRERGISNLAPDAWTVFKKLGEEGWELSATLPRSSVASTGGFTSPLPTGGMTTDELFVFKRPK